jgi:hypothetical protein
MADRFSDFESFWPHYLGEHSDPTTRALHALGTGLALGCLGAYALTRKRALLFGALAGGYGPAWVSHFFVEHNRPATFSHPLWSLRADLRMFRLTLLGQIDAEIARVGRPEGDARGATSNEAAGAADGSRVDDGPRAPNGNGAAA